MIAGKTVSKLKFGGNMAAEKNASKMLLSIAYTESFVMLAGIPCQTVLIVVLIWPGMAFGTSGSGLNIVRIFLKEEM